MMVMTAEMGTDAHAADMYVKADTFRAGGRAGQERQCENGSEKGLHRVT